MPFHYLGPPPSGALRQGEILSNVWEHRPVYPAVELPHDTSVDVESLIHPRVIVMTADCDLLWDYEARSRGSEQQEPADGERDDPSLLPHIAVCELYEEREIRFRIPGGSRMWRRIRENQEERYHRLAAAPIGDLQEGELPTLYLDFKKTLSLPTLRLYEALERSGIGRVAVMPPVYLHNLTHRFYTFLGRVAVPE